MAGTFWAGGGREAENEYAVAPRLGGIRVLPERPFGVDGVSLLMAVALVGLLGGLIGFARE
jgi:hypothetical protein